MRRLFVFSIVILFLVVGCGSQAQPTPTKTPRPTETSTPLPTLAAALPAIESNASGPVPSAEGSETEAAGASESAQTEAESAAGEGTSPLPTPEPTATVPAPTPTPGLEAQPPMDVLAANLSCGEGCTTGDEGAVGLAVLSPTTTQFNIWVANLAPLENEVYEGWLVQGSQVESTGRFNTETDGAAGEYSFLSADALQIPWESFVLTVEPEPDDSEAPATPHSIGGQLRQTVMGEALWSRFDMPCQQCHGARAEGGAAPSLAGAGGLAFPAFAKAVRGHAEVSLTEEAVANRDLQHIYAWLMTLP